MTGPFREEDFWNSPDWAVARNAHLHQFTDQDALNRAIALMRTAQYGVAEIDCSTKGTLASDISRTFYWREQFGYELDSLNLNAINDGVGASIAFPLSGRMLVVLRSFGSFWEQEKAAAWDILDIFQSRARDSLLFGKLLLIFVEVHGEPIEVSGLGSGTLSRYNCDPQVKA